MTGRPTRDEAMMEMARVMATRGTCTRKLVGVVIAREGRILATGYNGTPAGMPHCSHPPPQPLRPQPCTKSVHAEVNAIAFAAKHGILIDQSDLYTTYAPCLACSKLVVNAGIRRVFCGEAYHDDSGIELLKTAGVVVNCE